MSIRVRAIKPGQYGNVYRKVGDVFTLLPFKTMRGSKDGKEVSITAEEQFSHAWMERVSPKTPMSRGGKSTDPNDAESEPEGRRRTPQERNEKGHFSLSEWKEKGVPKMTPFGLGSDDDGSDSTPI